MDTALKKGRLGKVCAKKAIFSSEIRATAFKTFLNQWETFFNRQKKLDLKQPKDQRTLPNLRGQNFLIEGIFFECYTKAQDIEVGEAKPTKFYDIVTNKFRRGIGITVSFLRSNNVIEKLNFIYYQEAPQQPLGLIVIDRARIIQYWRNAADSANVMKNWQINCFAESLTDDKGKLKFIGKPHAWCDDPEEAENDSEETKMVAVAS